MEKMNKSENEKKQLDAQLQQLQELKFIGLIAGGIVHSFNNVIGVIRGYADLALRSTSSSDSNHDYLKHIIEGAYSAKNLADKMRTFARQKKLDLKLISIHPVVKQAIKIFEGSRSFSPTPHDKSKTTVKNTPTGQIFKESPAAPIDIQQDIDTMRATVLADADQIQQVVINLCNNAYDALCENGGILKVILKEVDVGSSFAEGYERLNEGRYVKLTVSDTGRGMDQNILKQIYEPFFTTKKINEHAGLGLAVVDEIVKCHKGTIIVESEPDHGTTFEIYLPAVNQKLT